MADQHPDTIVESSDAKGVVESTGVTDQHFDEGVNVADVALESLKSNGAENQHSDKDLSINNVVVTSLESTKVANQHSDEGVSILDVAPESLKSKDVENQHSDKYLSKTNVVGSSGSTSMADRHLDEGVSITDGALESLKSKGLDNQYSSKDLSVDSGENQDKGSSKDHDSVTSVENQDKGSSKDRVSDGSVVNQIKGSSKDHLSATGFESSSVENLHSQKGSSTCHNPVTSLESTVVGSQRSDEGASIADVALESLKPKDVADKNIDVSAITNNVNVKTLDSKLEISVKTLDSHLHSFNVDKNMIVSAFKEKIASEVDHPVEQQQLIFRGQVLKDDDLLSKYQVESGHTLHLVARQPSEFQPSYGSPNAETPARSINAVLGTFGSNDQDVGGNQDISQVIGAVLNSFGIEGQVPIGSIGTTQPNMQFSIPMQVAQGTETGANVNNYGQTRNQSQPTVPTLATPIPESLYTLMEFINHMERAFSHNGYQPSNSTQSSPTIELPSNSRGLLSPVALVVVLRHAQRLLSGPALDSFSHIARRLEEEEGSSDVTVRTQIQTEAMQSGLAMQHLGALLLELGRTMLTLRIGESPSESSVNVGPAVYISPSGPNPIMVQPFPLQTHSLFGDHDNSTINPSAFGSIGVGSVPRHINVHVHVGGVNPQTRSVSDNTRSGHQAFAGKPDAGLPEVRTDTGGGSGNTTSKSTRMKSKNEEECGSSSNKKSNTPRNASGISLGLGLGNLQPKRNHRQTRSEVGSSSSSTSFATNQSLASPASGQLDPTTIINQVMKNPATLNGLMQNPTMMNTINQLAQHMDGNQDFASTLGGSSGNLDMSNIVQQMMPFVSHALNRGSSSSNLLQSATPARKGTLHRRYSSVKSLNVKERSSNDLQMNLENAAQKIVEQYPPLEIFSSIVETASALHNNVFYQGALDELCMQEELAQEFIDMLKRDISRRLQGGRK